MQARVFYSLKLLFMYAQSKLLRHLMWWLLFFGFQLFAIYLKFGFTTYLVDLTLYFPVFILLFYAYYAFVYRLYDKTRKWWLSLLIFLVLQVVYHLVNYLFVNEVFSGLLHREYYLPHYNLGDRGLVGDTIGNTLQYSLFAYMYWQSVLAVRNERKFRVSQTEKLTVQNEKLQVEYDLLQSQINPHFLYNTLDYFYAQTLKHDKPAAEGIAVLSEIMRYSLHSSATEGKVLLEEEVQQLENYIYLQQLRHENAMQVVFEKEGVIPAAAQILPHLLITLVENALKHGETDDPHHPVTIRLVMQEGNMLFTVTNKISGRVKDKVKGGIGLQNTIRRMEMEYPGRHDFSTHAENGIFVTKLRLELSKEVDA
jgi:two-component system, LytTR family, sensor kinase